VSKSDLRLAAYGDVDEFNSILGLLISTFGPKVEVETHQLLRDLQIELFNAGSLLACPVSDRAKFKLPPLDAKMEKRLESEIDRLTRCLPQLKNFILPGGTSSASTSHLARTVCRRVERALVNLSEREEDADIGSLIILFNRLSDYLFTLARWLNHSEAVADIPWRGKTTS
jgi:cob(I)alamin adenosyltransferase